jgi:hypothetical protein
LPQGGPSQAINPKKLFGSSSTLGGRLSDRRRHVTLLLEPLQRRVKGTIGASASGSSFNLLMDSHSVCIALQAQDRHEHEGLELAEGIYFLISSTLHNHNVEESKTRVKRF